MSLTIRYIIFSLLLIVSSNGNTQQQSQMDSSVHKSCCSSHTSNRFKTKSKFLNRSTKDKSELIWVAGGEFMMGADNNQARKDEFPKHKVYVKGFYIQTTEVTNKQFAEFVKATGYITTAEKDVDWEQLKKQLPEGSPKPDSETLKAASLVFIPTKDEVDLGNYGQWWQWTHGADWKHPQGSGSNIIGKDNYPVVQISWDDACAYCKWAGYRLPTEAEWEFAARGGLVNKIYTWGDEPVDSGNPKCNYWQGKFPYQNDLKDSFYRLAPVKSFPPNGYGLFDMSGNVWEWCADLYNNNYYAQFENGKATVNPLGPETSYDPDEPLILKRVIRGGSFLCSESYCSGYRCSSRMKTSPDSGMEHLGFRCVVDK